MTNVELIEDLVKVQCSDGNWNFDPYMCGIANGMILCLAVLQGHDPVYLEPPETWLKDMPTVFDLPTSSGEG